MFCGECVLNKMHDTHQTLSIEDFLKEAKVHIEKLADQQKTVDEKCEEVQRKIPNILELVIDKAVKKMLENSTSIIDSSKDLLQRMQSFKQGNEIKLDFTFPEINKNAAQLTKASEQLASRMELLDRKIREFTKEIQFADHREESKATDTTKTTKGKKSKHFANEISKIIDKNFNDLLSKPKDSLASLKIRLCHAGPVAEQLRDIFKLQRNLKNLSIDFTTCGNINFQIRKSILTSVMYNQNKLENLTLKFDGSQSDLMTDNQLESLCIYLATLHLQGLVLEFKELKISDDGIAFLKDALRYLYDLQSLKIRITECKDLTDKSLNALADGIRTIKNLSFLQIGISQCDKINDKGVDYLIDTMKKSNLGLLKYLGLNFSGCKELTDKSAKYICFGLGSFSSLERLVIDMRFCEKITDSGVEYLGKGIQTLLQLQHFELHVGGSSKKNSGSDKITDLGMKRLMEFLQGNITISTLAISFVHCNKLTDQGLRHLRDTLKSYYNLRELTLNFKGGKLTDHGCNSLRKVIKHLTNLEFLELDLSLCKDLTDNTLNYMKEAIRKLPTISNLKLSFQGCDNFTDNGGAYLRDMLSAPMAKIHLCLEKLTPGMLNSIKEGIRQREFLSDFGLFYNKCDVSNKELDKVRLEFGNIASFVIDKLA